jgi:hypothetical protein
MCARCAPSSFVSSVSDPCDGAALGRAGAARGVQVSGPGAAGVASLSSRYTPPSRSGFRPAPSRVASSAQPSCFVHESAHSDSWVNGAPVSITALHFRSMPERPLRGPADGVQGSHCRCMIFPLSGGLPVVQALCRNPSSTAAGAPMIRSAYRTPASYPTRACPMARLSETLCSRDRNAGAWARAVPRPA